MTNTIVQTIVLPWMQALAWAALPLLGTLALALLRKHGIDTAWFEAIGRAGGAGVTAALAAGKGLNTPEGRAIAVQGGADYLRDRAADVIAAKGGRTPFELAQIADAELGKLLAVDPTVPTGSAPRAPLPALPPITGPGA